MSIRLTDKLVAATGSKIIADAVQVAGGYMAITAAQKSELTAAQKVDGTLVFNVDDHTTSRWNEDESEWEEININPDLSKYYTKDEANSKFLTTENIDDTLQEFRIDCGSSTKTID